MHDLETTKAMNAKARADYERELLNKAAPDLLEACEIVRDYICEWSDMEKSFKFPLQKINNAISKARGI